MTPREKILVKALRYVGSFETASMAHNGCYLCDLIKTAQKALKKAKLKLKVKT